MRESTRVAAPPADGAEMCHAHVPGDPGVGESANDPEAAVSVDPTPVPQGSARSAQVGPVYPG